MAPYKKAFVVNRSINYTELDKFNYTELIYYKVVQSLLQTGASIIKWGNFFTKRGRYYKVYKVLQSITKYYKAGITLSQSGADDLLESGAIVIKKCDRYYKVGQLYKKVG